MRDKCAARSWEKFEQMLASTPAGNGGNIGTIVTLVLELVQMHHNKEQSGVNWFRIGCYNCFYQKPEVF